MSSSYLSGGVILGGQGRRFRGTVRDPITPPEPPVRHTAGRRPEFDDILRAATTFVDTVDNATNRNMKWHVMRNPSNTKTVVLYGEDHYAMSQYFAEHPDRVQPAVDAALEFARITDADILVEHGTTPYEEQDLKIWHDFLDENPDLTYTAPGNLLTNVTLISAVTESNSPRIKGMDLRQEVDPLHDSLFMTNFFNTMANMFKFFGSNPEIDEEMATSIINQIDVVIVRKLVVYLLKHRAVFTSTPELARVYQFYLDHIKYVWSSFIRFVQNYKASFLDDSSEQASKDEIEEALMRVVYSLNAQLLDLNIVRHILVSIKSSFVVFAGEAHATRIREYLSECNFDFANVSLLVELASTRRVFRNVRESQKEYKPMLRQLRKRVDAFVEN